MIFSPQKFGDWLFYCVCKYENKTIRICKPLVDDGLTKYAIYWRYSEWSGLKRMECPVTACLYFQNPNWNIFISLFSICGCCVSAASWPICTYTGHRCCVFQRRADRSAHVQLSVFVCFIGEVTVRTYTAQRCCVFHRRADRSAHIQLSVVAAAHGEPHHMPGRQGRRHHQLGNR